MQKQLLRVSPSLLGFLYDECPACFYREVRGLGGGPRAPFPAVFGTIDGAIKRHFAPPVWRRLDEAMTFRVLGYGKAVESAAATFRDLGVSVAVRGKYDSLLELETGEIALCNFKTSVIRPSLIPKYARQLHAYAYALSNPSCGDPTEVDRLGLAVFEPRDFSVDHQSLGALTGQFKWLEVPRERSKFLDLLYDVAKLLSADMPKPSENCLFCSYREAA
jgi:hypothetical protein